MQYSIDRKDRISLADYTHLFQGSYDNTDVAKKIMSIMGVQFQ